MSKIRISKQFSFEMAHALDFHEGKCRNLHGHSYELEVTVIGEPKTEGPATGMIIDFVDLKSVVKRLIVDPLDHALMLAKGSSYLAQVSNTKLVVVDFQPTAENMVKHFAGLLQSELQGCELFSVVLNETRSSSASWHASDN